MSYRGRFQVGAGFKSAPVKKDQHLRTVLRYLERNAVSAKQVMSALDYRGGSDHVRQNGRAECADPLPLAGAAAARLRVMSRCAPAGRGSVAVREAARGKRLGVEIKSLPGKGDQLRRV